MSEVPDPPLAPVAEIGRALGRAGVPALVLSEPDGFPHVELLVAHGSARAAHHALDQVGWRWRVGADGAWRHVPRRRYGFDGGFVVTVHHALPAGPLPARALRPLERSLWADARPRGEDRLLRAAAAPLAVQLAVQSARGALRSAAQLAELRALLQAPHDRVAAHALARAVGAGDALSRALGEPGAEPRAGVPARAAVAASAWRVARIARERGNRTAVVQALLGEPWRSAVTRCRFDGLELLAGPGTFLPRSVSEQLVRTAVARLGAVQRPLAVDVGTGCGAIALALARRLPHAQVLGFDVDERALRWARRNGRRLRMRHVRFRGGSLLEPLPPELRGRISLVAANVPCLPPDAFEGSIDAPACAYVGTDPDGLGLQRELAADARSALQAGGWLIVQLAPAQGRALEQTLRDLGYDAVEVSGGAVAVVATARWSDRLGR